MTYVMSASKKCLFSILILSRKTFARQKKCPEDPYASLILPSLTYMGFCIMAELEIQVNAEVNGFLN